MTAPSSFTKIATALISVSDKRGVAEFARTLAAMGVKIISTGGTARLLADAGIAVVPVADITGMAEMMDGRVKTLHPKIHGGILFRRDDENHLRDCAAQGIEPIDLVVVNLYPFGETLKKKSASRKELVENIDIGGPAMIRAAAKNHDFVSVITDADDYETVLDEIKKHDGVRISTRRRLAMKAFAHTARYDAQIAGWMHSENSGDGLPQEFSLGGEKIHDLRYGENAHQIAAGYITAPARPSALTAKQIGGKQVGYNNLNDSDAAFELVAEFAPPSIAIIKHANPCGVASAENLSKAWDKALACDSVSAFGGIVAANRKLDGAIAKKITAIFTEVIIAPDADDAAKKIIAGKKNLRLLLTGGMPGDDTAQALMVKSVGGGFLLQSRDDICANEKDIRCVTKRKPSKAQIRDMLFAMRVAKHTKSNAIIFAKDEATIGIGAGQMSRIDAANSAVFKAWKSSGMVEEYQFDPILLSSAADEERPPPFHFPEGTVMASDAFLPFADCLRAAAEADVRAAIQPGGSINDDKIIEAADDMGIAMVFTGMRHFRH